MKPDPPVKKISAGIEEILDDQGIRYILKGAQHNSYLLLFLDEDGKLNAGYLCSPNTTHLVSLVDVVDSRMFHDEIQAAQTFRKKESK